MVPPCGWHRVRLCSVSSWNRSRDEALRNKHSRPDIDREKVEVKHGLENGAYDRLLAESVLVTEIFGAAANNLIVECMVRGTPILVNRLPAIEEYLGTDYPLFYSDIGQIPALLQSSRLTDASGHLRERARELPTFDQFAQAIREFTDSLEPV